MTHLLIIYTAFCFASITYAQHSHADSSEVLVFLKGKKRGNNIKRPLIGLLQVTNKITNDTHEYPIDKSVVLRLDTSSHYKIVAFHDYHFSFDTIYTPSKSRDTLTITLQRIQASRCPALEPILFKQNSATTDPSYFEYLNDMIELFQTYNEENRFDEEQELILEIHGQQCPTEKKEVSLQRAEALKNYVMSKGVPKNLIKVIDEGSKFASYLPNSCGKAEFKFAY